MVQKKIYKILKSILFPLSSFVVIILLWQILDISLLSESENFPNPIEVFRVMINDIQIDELFNDIFSSLSRVFIGLLIAIFFGVLLGVGLATMGKLGLYFTGYIEFFRPISPIAWIPIAILWFGIGEPSAYFIIFLAAFFPIFTNTFSGANSVKPIHKMVADSMLISRFQYLHHILFPTAIPQIMTGIRIGLGFAWMAVIASEMVAAQSGLGYMIQINRLLMQSEKVIVGMVVIGIIGYLMNQIASLLGKKLVPWEENQN